jgi:dsDNA-specific endonuclease/ATPase MutS2
MERNSELEKMVEKSVKFSDPIEQPSNNVQKLKKEVLELEFKLKHSAILEAELRSEIEMLRKNQNTNTNTNQTPVNKIFIDKKKSDPEISIRL